MTEKLSKKEAKQLRAEREAILVQAETFLEDDDYELLTELFSQISELSTKLGDNALAAEFRNRAVQIRSILDAPETAPPPQTSLQPPASYPAPQEPAPLPQTYSQPLPSYITPPEPEVPSTAYDIPEPSQYSSPESPSYHTPPLPSTKPQPEVPPLQTMSDKLQQIKNIAGSLIGQRRSEQGSALDSGIIPTVVRDESEVIMEILNEKLPFMNDKQKQDALKKIIEKPSGPQRDAWLKVFLIKNKQYAKEH